MDKYIPIDIPKHIEDEVHYYKALERPYWESRKGKYDQFSSVPENLIRGSVTWSVSEVDNYVNHIERNRHGVNFDSKCFQEITKDEYYSILDGVDSNDTLLEKAIKDYPPGTVFIPTHLSTPTSTTCIVSETDIFKWSSDSAYILLSRGNIEKNGHNTSEVIYQKNNPSGKWAKIIEQKSSTDSTLDLKDTRIWIGNNPILASQVQQKLFDLGYTWSGSKKVSYENADYYAISLNSELKHGNSRKYFDDSSRREIFLKDLGIDIEDKSILPERFKIWIGEGNNYDSMRVQLKLFDLGYIWDGGSTKVNTTSTINSLYINDNKISYGSRQRFFDEESPQYTEISFGNLGLEIDSSQMPKKWSVRITSTNLKYINVYRTKKGRDSSLKLKDYTFINQDSYGADGKEGEEIPEEDFINFIKKTYPESKNSTTIVDIETEDFWGIDPIKQYPAMPNSKKIIQVDLIPVKKRVLI